MWKSYKSSLIVIFYGSLMINTDTLNLPRLNSVLPHQPGDRNEHTRAHAHAGIILTRLDCQLAYSWETVAMATPDVPCEGVVACVWFFFPSSMLSSLVILYPCY